MRIRSIKRRSIESLKSIFLALACLSLFYSAASAQNKPDYQIGILLEERSAEIEALLPQLQKEIIAVVGEDANVTFPEKWILSNNNDLGQAGKNLEILNGEGPDMILAFGAINSVVITRQESFPKPTLLFGAVPADFISIEERRENSGINNFVYLVTSHSLREDLDSFRDLYDFKDLGIAVNRTITENLEVENYLQNIFSDSSLQYTLIPFSDVSDIITELDEIDALYIEGGDFFSAEEIALLVGELNLRKLPSMTATAQQDVEAGILATKQSQSNVEQLFRRIALSVEAVINGTNPSELPLYFEPREELTINFNTAETLGIPIRYSQIARTNLVGELDKLGAEKKYDLKMLMDEVLLSNLGLKVSRLGVDLVDQDVRLAKSNYLPNLEFSASGTNVDPALAEVSNGQNPEYSTAANATVSQVIYAPGASANIRIQKELLEAEKENLNTEKLNVIFDASTLYFNTLLVKANLQITKSNMDLTEENLELAQQRYESGEAGKSDVLRFESQLAQNTQQFVEGYNQLQQAYFTINQLLNQPIRRRIDVLDASLDDGIYSEYNYDSIKEILDDPILIEPFISFLIN
ncbi:MAG: TolC family protein [Bacteroidota bacterium]